MASNDEPEDDGLETLIAFSTIGEAQVAAGLLESAGIDVLIADEAVATTAPHWGPAMGGYRVQVPRSEITRAREVLSADDDGDESPSRRVEGFPAMEEDPDDPRPNPREAAALRAWRAAVGGIVLVPVLLHLYSVLQLATVVQREDRLTTGARHRAIAAAVIDALVIAGALWFIATRFELV